MYQLLRNRAAILFLAWMYSIAQHEVLLVAGCNLAADTGPRGQAEMAAHEGEEPVPHAVLVSHSMPAPPR